MALAVLGLVLELVLELALEQVLEHVRRHGRRVALTPRKEDQHREDNNNP